MPAALDRRARLWFALSALCGLLLAGVDASIAFAVRELLAAPLLGWPVAAGLVGLVVARGLAHLAMMGASHLGREAYATALRKGTLAWLVHHSHEMSRGAGVVQDLVDTHPRALVHVQMRAGVLAQLAQMLVLAAAALVLAPTVAPMALALLGVVGLVVVSTGRALQRRAGVAVGAHRAFLSDVQRIVATMPIVRALRLEALESARAEARIEEHAQRARHAAALTAIAAALPTLAGAPILVLALAAVLWSGAPSASAVAFVLVLVRLVLVASSAASTWSTARATADAHVRAAERAQAPAVSNTTSVRSVGSAPSIQFTGVAVRFDAREIASGVSLTIAPGEHLAIVGPTGAGKSTLIDIVLGLREPDGGSILVDDEAPAVYLSKHRVGYLGPSPCLFPGTLRENLSLGSEGATDTDLERALRQAGAEDLLSRHGLSATIGEGGSPLSSGERQRLALARALVGAPALLVLDEPTAHVDPETAGVVLASIRSLVGHTTCVMSSHEPALVGHCAHTIELSERR